MNRYFNTYIHFGFRKLMTVYLSQYDLQEVLAHFHELQLTEHVSSYTFVQSGITSLKLNNAEKYPILKREYILPDVMSET